MFEPKISVTSGTFDSLSDTQVILFSGQLDKLGLEKIRKELEEMLEKSASKNFIFDFAELEFINSESIGFLVSLRAHLAKKSRNIHLIHLNSHVRDVLDTIGLLTVFSA